MNSVVRPRGSRPPAVYWRRRIVLLAVVVLVLVAVAKWVGGGDEPAPTAARDTGGQPADQGSEQAARSTAAQTAGSEAGSRGAQARQDPAARRFATKQRAERKSEPIRTVLAAPEGACEVTDVVAVPDVVDARSGGPVALRLGLSTLTKPACTLTLESNKIAVEVTSGEDVIWRSMDCDRLLEPQTVVLRRGWLTYVDLDWSGRRGTGDCSPTNAYAKPGYYWADAALVGGEPHRGQFRLTSKPARGQASGDVKPDAQQGEKPDAQQGKKSGTAAERPDGADGQT